MVDDTHPVERVQLHAKLLTYRGVQALAFVQRDDDETLSIIVQLWCGPPIDHQIRLAIKIDGASDEVAYDAFKDLNDDALASFIDETGLLEMIEAAR